MTLDIHKYKLGERYTFGKTVIALGLFDGVHKGHRALIAKAKETAEKEGLTPIVFTFDSDNTNFKSNETLYTSKQKTDLISSLGINHIIYADFSELANMSAANFVKSVLIDSLSCKYAVTGLDFKFGKGREGNTSILSDILEDAEAHLITVADINDKFGKISTARIKLLLKNGECRHAAELLGVPYYLEDEVRHGLGLGRSLGTPTVNISLQKSFDFLRSGVYASLVEYDQKYYTGVTNIGTCPTFGERERHSETYILNFNSDLYEKRIKVYLLEHLRDEIKFASKEELSLQIKRDSERSSKIAEDYSHSAKK